MTWTGCLRRAAAGPPLKSVCLRCPGLPSQREGCWAGLCLGRCGLGWTSSGGVSWSGARALPPFLCFAGCRSERCRRRARAEQGTGPKERCLPPKGLRAAGTSEGERDAFLWGDACVLLHPCTRGGAGPAGRRRFPLLRETTSRGTGSDTIRWRLPALRGAGRFAGVAVTRSAACLSG